eukprot:3671574-Amphidinium_carterae.2
MAQTCSVFILFSLPTKGLSTSNQTDASRAPRRHDISRKTRQPRQGRMILKDPLAEFNCASALPDHPYLELKFSDTALCQSIGCMALQTTAPHLCTLPELFECLD